MTYRIPSKTSFHKFVELIASRDSLPLYEFVNTTKGIDMETLYLNAERCILNEAFEEVNAPHIRAFRAPNLPPISARQDLRRVVHLSCLMTLAVLIPACAHTTTPSTTATTAEELPVAIAQHARVSESDAGDVCDRARGEVGRGGVSECFAVQLVRRTTIYRLWNGPESEVDNRTGSWWTLTPPAGTVHSYRESYAVCSEWNDLMWVATCSLDEGTIIAVGPGQSATCRNPDERYPANSHDLQVYVPDVRNNPGLHCPPPTSDYRADPNDLSAPVE